MNNLLDKRYSVTIGFSVAPEDAQSVYTYGHRYGKLTYEDMVLVQGIAAKHRLALEQATEAMVDELLALGFAQAEDVKGKRNK